MKLTILALNLLTLSSSFAEASALPKAVGEFAQKKAHQLTATQTRTKLAKTTGCADFSGTWAGTCQIDGKEEAIRFTLKQEECKSVELDGDSFEFGTNKSGSYHSMLFFGHENAAYKLSPEGNSIRAYATLMADSPILPEPVLAQLFGTMAKEGDSLNLDGKIAMRIGQGQTIEVGGACRLAKSN